MEESRAKNAIVFFNRCHKQLDFLYAICLMDVSPFYTNSRDLRAQNINFLKSLLKVNLTE